MNLIKFLSRRGICARRKVKDLLAQGVVKINGQVVTDQFTPVSQEDVVIVRDKRVALNDYIYVLLNKPKDYLSTCSDVRGRKIVLELVTGATNQRIYPVGRLDRATTGLLLLTNDGDLTQKLSHPSNNITKTYLVTLDRPCVTRDVKKFLDGIDLEDGPIAVDRISFGRTKKEVIIQLHSGRNRIIRRMFSHLYYRIKTLDRIGYANLTKTGLPRGKWRFLTPSEIKKLKQL